MSPVLPFAVRPCRGTARWPWGGRSSTWIPRRCLGGSGGRLGGGGPRDRPSLPVPLQGIQFLVENELLQNTPEEISRFLYKGEGLNKTAIGDYLGEREELNLAVLHAFVDLHEFTDLNLVQALRQFLWSFRLPGEAQKIDRMMEAFAQRYCLCNPGVFQSTDTCYVLSFAVIMLNTSLHNPNVRDKPGVERFITMNRGINNGGDLPEELLRNLYDSIRNEPFKIPEDDGNDLTHTFFNPDREGWLLKLGTAPRGAALGGGGRGRGGAGVWAAPPGLDVTSFLHLSLSLPSPAVSLPPGPSALPPPASPRVRGCLSLGLCFSLCLLGGAPSLGLLLLAAWSCLFCPLPQEVGTCLLLAPLPSAPGETGLDPAVETGGGRAVGVPRRRRSRGAGWRTPLSLSLPPLQGSALLPFARPSQTPPAPPLLGLTRPPLLSPPPPPPSLTGGRVKTWKRRWFILTDNCLYYFEYTTDKEPRGIIPLENLSIREVEDPRKPNCFELYIPNNKGQLIKACKTEADGRVVEGNHMVYRISAPTQEEKDEWIKSIKAAVSVDPFYEMLAARKKRISVKKKQEQA
uniref:Cytohesin-2 n=1 Tax=Sarcophilus harrisii TaxID=9305 RepID=A0A7N4PCQ6_SARHA